MAKLGRGCCCCCAANALGTGVEADECTGDANRLLWIEAPTPPTAANWSRLSEVLDAALLSATAAPGLVGDPVPSCMEVCMAEMAKFELELELEKFELELLAEEDNEDPTDEGRERG